MRNKSGQGIQVEKKMTSLDAIKVFVLFHNLTFAVFLIFVFLSILFFMADGSKQRTLIDYSFFAETMSGALLLVKPTSPASIQVDDDIAISAYGNQLKYETVNVKGKSEPYGDGIVYFQVLDFGGRTKEISASMTIGSVRCRIPFLGNFMIFLSDNIVIVLSILALALISLCIINRIIERRFANHIKNIADNQKKKNNNIEGNGTKENMEVPASVRKKHSYIAAMLANIVFYGALMGVLIAASLYNENSGSPLNLFGYSFFTVLTSSMQSEIPKGSLVISKRVDTDTIEIGDNITFRAGETTTVTHRVENIYENYEKSGMRGFVTKGVDNNLADQDIVYATNIIGTVVFHVADLGDLFTYIANNVWIVLLLFGILIAFSFILRVLIRTMKEDKRVLESQ